MKKFCLLGLILTVLFFSCASDPQKNKLAKEQLPKGNYTMVETTINGRANSLDLNNIEAPNSEFMDFTQFPDGYTFNLSDTDTITFAKEMGEYLFDGTTFTYTVDGDELEFKNNEISTNVAYKLQGDTLILFPDKGDLEKLTFKFTPFETGYYDVMGYSLQKSANHRIAHKFLKVNNGRPLFDFKENGMVHIAPALGLKVFGDSIFTYEINDKTMILKNKVKTNVFDYKAGGAFKLYVNDTIFTSLDLVARKPDQTLGSL